MRQNLPEIPQNAPLAIANPAEIQAFLLQSATSDNTRRSYQAAIRHYLNWGGLLPADENTILQYLLAHKDTQKPQTLQIKLTALSNWHTYQNAPDPTKSPQIRKILLGIKRVHGTPPQKAAALPVQDLQKIIEKLQTETDLTAIRDAALLAIGFFGAFRRSELVNIRVEDLDFSEQGVQIVLPKSKTDQTGLGIVKTIPYGNHSFCPVRLLEKWLLAANIQTGFVFVGISQWQTIQIGRALTPASVNLIVKKYLQTPDLQTKNWSSHSLRRGLATSAHRAGASLREIKRQGGWRHDATVQGYIDDAEAFSSENAAGKLLGKTAP